MDSLEFFESRVENTISPMDYMQLAKTAPESYVLVDVRNAPAHLKKEKISGSIELMQNSIENKLEILPKNKTIIVYCWDVWCNLASKSAIILIKNGYNVKELAGGIAAWKSLNLQVENLV